MSCGLTRRRFLQGTGAAVVTLSLGRLRLQMAPTPAAAAASLPPPYRQWEDVYRERWQWDKIVKGTHLRSNCISACAWDLYVKDDLVWREEQAAVYAPTNASLPDFNPRGCQKGACYSALMYSPARLKYPLQRAGERGAGRWRRISWEEALTTVADAVIDTCLINGPECIVYEGGSTNVDFGPDTAAEMRFINLLGATTLDSNGAGVGDTALGAAQTWGVTFVDGTADDWMHADYLIIWCMNPSYTRIPEAHFLWEARYHGTRVVVIAPDYNATAMHADLWLNPRVGTDAALALGIAQVIVEEGLYQADYVKEQTDLPLLVRTDNRRFLRAADLWNAGREDVFFFWDTRSRQVVEAPGSEGHPRQTLRLAGVDPALEGTYEVALADGHTVAVQPVFTLLREQLRAYLPEKVEPISGVAAGVIREVAQAFARARATTIIASFGACKHYHSDLMQRALILLLALTGNQGKRGGGLRIAAWWSMSGFEDLAGAYEAPFYLRLLARMLQPSARRIESYVTRLMRDTYLLTPTLLWLYVHGGIEKLAPEVAGAVDEALRRGWMPVYPRRGQDPQVMFCTGGNPLRRWPAPRLAEERLWPKLKSIIAVNFRMSTTALKADLILPAAAYYEKSGVKYAQSYLPYVVVGEQAVRPFGEAKSEWEIFGLLARRVQERAREKGIGKYRDLLGLEHDLSALYESWSRHGKFPVEDEEKALDHIIANSEPTRGWSWKQAAQMGAVPIRAAGMFGPVNGIGSDFVAGDTVTPSQRFVEHKEPWPTLTGRQQFYIDHPWFIAAAEQLPCHKELPAIGGSYPLRLTGGHTRWSIHSIWRDEQILLRLQRGGPVMYMSVEDAEVRGVRDHDLVRVHNDAGSCHIHVKVSPAVQPGQVVIYHAWEPYQFRGWRSDQNAVPSPIKPLHLVGDYGQLHYRTGSQAPGYVPRGTAVEVERADLEAPGAAGRQGGGRAAPA